MTTTLPSSHETLTGLAAHVENESDLNSEIGYLKSQNLDLANQMSRLKVKMEESTSTLDSKVKELSDLGNVKTTFYQRMMLEFIDKMFGLKKGDKVWVRSPCSPSYFLQEIQEVTPMETLCKVKIVTQEFERLCDLTVGLTVESPILPSDNREVYKTFFKMLDAKTIPVFPHANFSPPPAPRVKTEDAKNEEVNVKFPVGTLVDCLDSMRVWTPAEVVKFHPETGQYYIHFIGWSSYSNWYQVKNLAPANSKVNHATYNKDLHNQYPKDLIV
jgi:hypothetical protein